MAKCCPHELYAGSNQHCQLYIAFVCRIAGTLHMANNKHDRLSRKKNDRLITTGNEKKICTD